jgi:hypothetical protein
VPCEALSLRLAEVVDGSGLLAPSEAQHVSTCLRCQAELAQYRKLLRSLRAMRTQPVAHDDGLLLDLLEALRPPASVTRLQRRTHRRAAYLGGLAAATAGAAGALVLASRIAGRPRLAS